MKSLAVLLGVLLCLVAVQARHVDKNENENPDELSENVETFRDRRGSLRHRRKRWQSNYGYDYPVPHYPYYPERRDQDLILQIYRLLDEISVYVRRPEPPQTVPQPIYVPYPYPVAQNCKCDNGVNTNSMKPNVTSRFPVMEDSNQNWGLTELNQDIPVDDFDDGARPISFEPIKPIRPMRRPSPKVEHGSNQASSYSPKKERTSEVTSDSRCDAAILSCCNDPQMECFVKFDCPSGYAIRQSICSKGSIDAALQAFMRKYSPV